MRFRSSRRELSNLLGNLLAHLLIELMQHERTLNERRGIGLGISSADQQRMPVSANPVVEPGGESVLLSQRCLPVFSGLRFALCAPRLGMHIEPCANVIEQLRTRGDKLPALPRLLRQSHRMFGNPVG